MKKQNNKYNETHGDTHTHTHTHTCTRTHARARAHTHTHTCESTGIPDRAVSPEQFERLALTIIELYAVLKPKVVVFQFLFDDFIILLTERHCEVVLPVSDLPWNSGEVHIRTQNNRRLGFRYKQTKNKAAVGDFSSILRWLVK